MQNQEFFPAGNPVSTDLTTDKPAGTQLPTLTVADLDGLLDVVSEEFILIERSSGDIKWVSYPCRTIAHKLGSTKNISEFPSLKKVIDDALPDSTHSKVTTKWHTNDVKWQQYIGDNRKSTVSVYMQPNQTDFVWVRLYRSSNQDEYIRESLAAHERLFSTSRDVSVQEMVTTLSHELNQPLGTLVNIVNGVKSRLISNGIQDREIHEALDLAQKQGQFASDILQRLRDFSHVKKPVITNFSVSDLASNTLELLDWLFMEESININLNIKSTSVYMYGDITLLQQVLVNLLRNSVQAMSESNTKRIDITISKEDDNVQITISDTGHGLKEGEEDNIFIPFNSQKTKGMGIGLNICRSFIELHQGRFWFRNNSSEGCTANIVLPNRIPTTLDNP